MKKIIPLMAMGFLAISAMNVQAGIISTTGPIDEITSSFPPSLLDGAFDSDSLIRVIVEKENHVLGANLVLDAGGTILAGTLVNSYLVHYDQVGGGSATQSGSLTFDSAILGVIHSLSNLGNSDSELGLLTAAGYSAHIFRGLELTTADSFSLTGATGISFSTTTNSHVDEMRIITAASPVPVPAAVWLFGSALLGLTGMSRRKKT